MPILNPRKEPYLADNSCSYDTVFTTLLAFRESLPAIMQQRYLSSLAGFCDVLSNMKLQDSKSIRAGKNKLMQRMFEIKGTNEVFEFEVNVIKDIELVLQHVIKEDSGPIDDVIRMKYSIEKSCVNGCPCIDKSKLRGLGIMQSTFLGLKIGDKYVENNVPEIVNNLWHRRAQFCEKCSEMLSITRNFINVPWIVVITLSYSNCSINDRKQIGEEPYRLFSVSYRSKEEDDGHYIALIRLNNCIYLYDGISNFVKSEVTISTDFHRNIRHNNVWYSVIVLWYKLEDVV